MNGGINLYGYAAGDPVNLSDPFGLCPREHECHDPDRDDWDAIWDALSVIANAPMCQEFADVIKRLLGDGRLRVFDGGARDPMALTQGYRLGPGLARISINSYYFDDPYETATTLVHEAYHVLERSGNQLKAELAGYACAGWMDGQ